VKNDLPDDLGKPTGDHHLIANIAVALVLLSILGALVWFIAMAPTWAS